MNNKPAADWLNKKYIEFEQNTGKRQTVTAFAKFCGIRQVDMSRYMIGSRPVEGDNLKKIGTALGEEIYDLVGKPRPDPRLWTIINSWGEMTDEARDELEGCARRTVERGTAEVDNSRVAASKRK